MGAEHVMGTFLESIQSRRVSLRRNLQGEPGIGFKEEEHLVPKERAAGIEVLFLGGAS